MVIYGVTRFSGGPAVTVFGEVPASWGMQGAEVRCYPLIHLGCHLLLTTGVDVAALLYTNPYEHWKFRQGDPTEFRLALVSLVIWISNRCKSSQTTILLLHCTTACTTKEVSELLN